MAKKEKKSSRDTRQELLTHYEEMKRFASRDALTGLLNRGALELTISDRLQDMTEWENCALFIVDLDNFKAVNDTMGHQTGDQVLAKAARSLAGMFRATDVVGRLGGDEFAVFLSGNLTEEMVRGKARHICDQLQYVMGVSSEVVVTASVGIHLASGKQTFEYLYRSADLALYRAKECGKQGYCIKTDGEGQEEPENGNYTTVNAVRMRSLLEYIDSGVAMVEMKDKMSLVYASPAFAKMVGVKQEELQKTSLLNLICPEDRKNLEDLFRNKVMEDNEAASMEIRSMGADGTTFWWRLHAVRVEYNETNPMILLSVVDISELKEKESALRKNNDIFRLAMSQTAQGIWEMELSEKMFRVIGSSVSFPEELQEPKAFPEELIAEGWVCPESADSFRDFAREIFHGHSQGYANFKICHEKGGKYSWASFSYRTVFDELGQPVRVVGIIEGMNYEYTSFRKQPKVVALPECLVDGMLVRFIGNLTENTVIYHWENGVDITEADREKSCMEVMQEEVKRSAISEGTVRLSDVLSCDVLFLPSMEKKERWMTCEYQRVDGDGKAQWVTCFINIYLDARNEQVYMALWIKDMDKMHRWENRFGLPVYKDMVHKLYTRSTVREISMRLLESKKHTLCALVMVEISGMARLHAQYSGNIDEKWRAVITALLLALGGDCVPGQFGTDRYLFFYPEVESEAVLKRRLEQAFLFVRNITADTVDGRFLRFTAGGVCRYRNETDYNILMKKVQSICQKWSNSSVDRVIFAGEEKEDGWEQLSKSTESDRIRKMEEGTDRPLSEREKDVALRCISEMFGAESLEESSRCVLRTLGEYYNADRTYILVPVDGGNIITMPHEWTSADKSSIQQVVSGTMASRFPLLKQCAEEKRPIVLTRHMPMENEKKTDHEVFWHFAVFPMEDDGGIQSYLCIENGKNYINDEALPAMLCSCLLKERKKYLKNAGSVMVDKGVLTMDLPNQKSYMREIYTYNSDVYDSMGVISVDVPDFAAVNTNKGFEYGRRLLWHIIQAMTRDFGRAFLYRTWDAEFVALCPNTGKELFFGKCARLRATLAGRYPGEIRMGYTWSDKVFSGKALADEARLLMRCDGEKTEETSEDYDTPAFAFYGSVEEMIQDGRLTVYFQPKIDMRTGEMVGAEALVRGIDSSGTLVYPKQFIGVLEKNGLIRDLDLFVLQRALEVMEQWKTEGKRLVPVSVNFSRTTLLDSWILSSVLAIYSRHSELESRLLEIELTESPGITSPQAMGEIMAQFREHGLSFSLDDFGAKSSNLDFAFNGQFSSIKLDRQFIAGITESEHGKIMLKDIVNICHMKKMTCIAEGVETEGQKEILLHAGCNYGQGYLYDEPLPDRKFAEKYLGSFPA